MTVVVLPGAVVVVGPGAVVVVVHGMVVVGRGRVVLDRVTPLGSVLLI